MISEASASNDLARRHAESLEGLTPISTYDSPVAATQDEDDSSDMAATPSESPLSDDDNSVPQQEAMVDLELPSPTVGESQDASNSSEPPEDTGSEGLADDSAEPSLSDDSSQPSHAVSDVDTPSPSVAEYDEVDSSGNQADEPSEESADQMEPPSARSSSLSDLPSVSVNIPSFDHEDDSEPQFDSVIANTDLQPTPHQSSATPESEIDPESNITSRIERQFEMQQRSNEDLVEQLARELGPSFDEMRDHQTHTVHSYIQEQQLLTTMMRAR